MCCVARDRAELFGGTACQVVDQPGDRRDQAGGDRGEAEVGAGGPAARPAREPPGDVEPERPVEERDREGHQHRVDRVALEMGGTLHSLAPRTLISTPCVLAARLIRPLMVLTSSLVYLAALSAWLM